MRHFLLTGFIVFFCLTSLGQSKKYEHRPNLTVNTSVATLFSWRVFHAPFYDFGVDYKISKLFSVNSAIGQFYRSPWNINRNDAKGHFYRTSFRVFPIRPNVFHPYVGVQVKHDTKRIDRVFDFSANNWPYSKKAIERRNTNFLFLEMGALNLLHGKRFILDVNVAIGFKRFKRTFEGLTALENIAAENGDVDGIPTIEPIQFGVGYLIDFKVGYSIF